MAEPVEASRGWCWRSELPPHVGPDRTPAIGVECVDVAGRLYCEVCWCEQAKREGKA